MAKISNTRGHPQPKPEPDTEGREVVQAVSRGAKMQTAKGKVLGN